MYIKLGFGASLVYLIENSAQEVHEVAVLRVLHMEGCGYLIHPSGLLEYMHRSLNTPSQLFFVVLDDDSPRVCS